MLVRFDPTYYTTTETKGSVTLWVGVDEAVSEPFTVALLPGESDVIYVIHSNKSIINTLFSIQGLRSLLVIIH